MSDFQAQRLLLSLDKAIPSDPSMLDDAVAEIMLALNRVVCWEDTDKIGIAIGQALANAIVHGNHCDPRKKVHISVALNKNCDLLVNVKGFGLGVRSKCAARPYRCGEPAGQTRQGLIPYPTFHGRGRVQLRSRHGGEDAAKATMA
jgi:anti-sigma regulatory factor (Ser/Thr protein kinase)